MVQAIDDKTQKIENLARIAADLFPKLDATEKKIALRLYKGLSEGKAVSPGVLASELGLPNERVRRFLSDWPGVDFDAEKNVVGFWGLSLSETNHQFEVYGRDLYTWCAWDTLFIPQLLQKTAKVHSACPVTGERLSLIITPKEVRDPRPSEIVLSFITPEAAKVQQDVVQHFCQYVHFFASADAGAHWVSQHPETFLLSLKDAFVLGQLKNKIRFAGTSL
ncbi:hypothetical protein MNBD_NITROSPIRAE01-436 [hydrothermal vent metagenome]|uniref:Uncharacterized protein n=1 Tax=hydrothermal vent metagenome TaxID=652676 RepID=A0A3B1D378_9ZZZZ